MTTSWVIQNFFLPVLVIYYTYKHYMYTGMDGQIALACLPLDSYN